MRFSYFHKLIILTIMSAVIGTEAIAHHPEKDDQRKIEFPDIPGYKTIVCDFHQHTVFSDGFVWPSIRVEEAIKDGLDAISITDHIEYQPHQKDIPHPDRNRSYEIASEAVKGKDLIVINGSEITRDMPPGHANAIFLKDVNKLIKDDPMEVFKEAKRQGAFIFWNHPNWIAQKKDGVALLTDMHRQLLKEDLLEGIEVVNEFTYSDEALQIALDHNLTIMGTSDIHGLIDWDYKVLQNGHRPVTFVFAKEKNESAIKEGLEKRRTVVWYNNLLIGRTNFVTPLINASLTIEKAAFVKNSSVVSVDIVNSSDMDMILKNQTNYTFHNQSDIIILKAHETTNIEVKAKQKISQFKLNFKVLNAIIAPNTHPDITLDINISN